MSIQAYQKRCFREYKQSLGLDENYTFLHGNPVKVLVPIETATNGVMVVGAYPSAKFYTINGISDVPLCDNDAPFSCESYFDGARVRTIPSGQELEENYFQNLGISRSDCWITDLVKIFLFKDGHIERYRKLGNTTILETRSRFSEFGKQSICWLELEIELAKPKVILSLGREVTSILFGVSETKATSLLDGIIHTLTIGNTTQNVLAMPHPGIIMKDYPDNPWPKRFKDTIIPNAKKELKALGILKS
jgi:uracil-DNA glycosylase